MFLYFSRMTAVALFLLIFIGCGPIVTKKMYDVNRYTEKEIAVLKLNFPRGKFNTIGDRSMKLTSFDGNKIEEFNPTLKISPGLHIVGATAYSSIGFTRRTTSRSKNEVFVQFMAKPGELYLLDFTMRGDSWLPIVLDEKTFQVISKLYIEQPAGL